MRFHGAVLASIALVAQAAPVADPASLQQIRREGLEHSQVMRPFDQFVTVIGPRLTGSPAHKAAAEWARQALASWGLSDARLEPWPFGRGWVLDHQVIEMLEPRYMPLIGYAEAWSAPTSGVLEAQPVWVAGKTAAEITAMAASLKGAIVLSQPLQNEFVRADRPQPSSSDAPVRIGAPPMPRSGNAGDARAIAQALHDAGAGVLLRPSAGEHGTVFVLGTDHGENAMPSMVLAAEHYNMIARMLEKGVAVKLRVGITTRYLTADTNSYNVVAELPGTDPVLANEVVLLGGHLDSWHTGTGASDNADGAAAVMEAMRILKAAGLQPRRTVRVALWSGEEEGLLGSKAYVTQHLARAARERISVYFNIDPGMGPIYGWYSEDSPAAKALFDAWLAPLRDLDARKNVIAGITNTDHLSFKAAGVPGFTPIQDYVTYDVRTHHTNVDTYERVREQDLKQNAVTLAWFAYNAAMMSAPFPR